MENLILLTLICIVIVCSLFFVGFLVLVLLYIREFVNNWIDSLEDPNHD
jgi:cell division protein FtsX